MIDSDLTMAKGPKSQPLKIKVENDLMFMSTMLFPEPH